MFSLPKNVTLIEVGPRDGLQNEKNNIPTEVKLSFIQALHDAGIKEMELTSFVSPKWVPQMKDAQEIVQRVRKNGRQLVLTPNKKVFTLQSMPVLKVWLSLLVSVIHSIRRILIAPLARV